jgi:hypothetical protein
MRLCKLTFNPPNQPAHPLPPPLPLAAPPLPPPPRQRDVARAEEMAEREKRTQELLKSTEVSLG